MRSTGGAGRFVITARPLLVAVIDVYDGAVRFEHLCG